MSAPIAVNSAGPCNEAQAQPSEKEDRLARLQHEIEHAAHLLPAQGPITVFIHHNTLHAFEDQPFAEGVKNGAGIFGCQAYLTEDRYREELSRGRIRFADLKAVLQEDLGERGEETIGRLATRRDLYLGMLQYPLRSAPAEELLWFIAETDALRRVRPDVAAAVREELIAETRHWAMRDLRPGNEPGRKGSMKNGSAEGRPGEPLGKNFSPSELTSIESWQERAWEAFMLQALWRVCRQGVAEVPASPSSTRPMVRHRDFLLKATGADSDAAVHEVLIRLCAAYLDQGVAPWQLPQRDKGLLRAFCVVYGQPGGPPDSWMAGLGQELARLEDSGITALESIQASLEAFGVKEGEWGEFLSHTFLALPGWAGMVRQVEMRGDRVARPISPGSLIEFMAVRLLLERFSLRYKAREYLGFEGPLSEMRQAARAQITRQEGSPVERRAFLVFQLAQVLGWAPPRLNQLTEGDWTALVQEMEAFSNLERRRVFHLAYERRFVKRSLDTMGLHPWPARRRPGPPRFQVVCCLDEREESLRRHLEEVVPEVETFGAAGFFGVAMYFRGVADAHFVPLCPIMIRPTHWVREEVDTTLEETHKRRAWARRALGKASHRFHIGSRTFALGALLTAGLGVLATIPLIARTIFPRLTARIRKLFGRFVQAPPATHLMLEGPAAKAVSENGHRENEQAGSNHRENPQPPYTLAELVDIGERQLRDIGLTRGFARLVFFLGHGSNSLNNPHKSAYDCGACCGSPGAANGRALAKILNDARVRERLAERGLHIPQDTVFVGGLHNTCDDSVTLYDLEVVPEYHQAELKRVRQDLETALDRNAHERCRRFMSAPLDLSFAGARQHVETRAADLAQTRPELGHATNALCIIGRRERTRGLYLDRRAFLTTYDPTQDDGEATILTRVLQAAVPVCAGINLEYYFSRVDSAGWGCGTKLPHNVTALLGVMDGAASDLRTGLPWQMVEIHEPMRLLFIIESTPDTMLRIMERQSEIGQVFRNGWALLAVQDPYSEDLQYYRDGVFRPYELEATDLPRAASSVDWYRGWRDHLEFARIG